MRLGQEEGKEADGQMILNSRQGDPLQNKQKQQKRGDSGEHWCMNPLPRPSSREHRRRTNDYYLAVTWTRQCSVLSREGRS